MGLGRGRPAAAGRQGSEFDFGIVAHLGRRAGDGGERHLGGGDEAIGAVPQLARVRGHGDEADRGIGLVVPPGLVPIGPEFPNLGAIVAELCLAGDNNIFVAAAIDPGQRDGGKALDLAILVALDIDEEMNGMLLAEDAGRERPALLLFAIPGGEHADIDLLGEFPDPIGHFRRGLLIIVGMFLGHGGSCCCGQEEWAGRAEVADDIFAGGVIRLGEGVRWT